MKRRYRSYDYKFTEKIHSKKGMLGLFMAVLSMLLGVAMIWNSFLHQGKGTVYLGSFGMLSMLLALAALAVSVYSLREENRYRAIPIAATVCSALVLGGWIALYVVGFLSA